MYNRFLHKSAVKRPQPPSKPLVVSLHELLPKSQAFRALHTSQLSNDDALEITFHRTLRIPCHVRTAASPPPGYDSFPIYNTDEYAEKLPEEVVRYGGAFIPMYQREALFIAFTTNRPFAIKIYLNDINIQTGILKPPKPPAGFPPNPWITTTGQTQDYIVTPFQQCVDGVNSFNGVRQFVVDPPSIIQQQSQYQYILPPLPPSVLGRNRKGSGEKFDERKEGKRGGNVYQKLFFEIVPLKKKELWVYMAFKPDRGFELVRVEVWKEESIIHIVREVIDGWVSGKKVLLVSYCGHQVGSFETFEDLDVETGDTIYVYLDYLHGPFQPGHPSFENGTLVRPRIWQDPFQPEDWDIEKKVHFTVQLLPVPFVCQTTGLSPPITGVSKFQYEKNGFPFEDVFIEEGGWGDKENAEEVEVVETVAEVGDETMIEEDEEVEDDEEETWESGSDDSDSKESRVSIGGTYHKRGEPARRIHQSPKVEKDGNAEQDGKGYRPKKHKRTRSRKSGGGEDVQAWVDSINTREGNSGGALPGGDDHRKSAGAVLGGILKFEGQERKEEKRKSIVSFGELPRIQFQEERRFSASFADKRKSCSLIDLPKLLLPQEEKSFVVQRRDGRELSISGRAKEKARMILDE